MIEQEITRIAESSGKTRLDVIASMDLGRRSEAARRVIEKRAKRRKLIEIGFSPEEANLMIQNYGYNI